AAAAGQAAYLRAVACPSAGWCVAVGSYVATGPALPTEGFVVTGSPGAWSANAIAALAPANVEPTVSLAQVACAAPDQCATAGTFIAAGGASAGLEAVDAGGTWSVGPLALPPDASAYPAVAVSGVACPSESTCAVAGAYETAAGRREAFVTSLGAAATELVMPDGARANPIAFFFGYADFTCAAPGDCALGGQYRDEDKRYQGFLVDEVGGSWRAATRLRLPASARQVGRYGGVVAVTCPAPGECRAGGAYLDARGRYQAYVVGERADRWTDASTIALPGGATTVGVDGGVYGLACASYSRCTAAGSYVAAEAQYEGFVARLG
ncbi:MAG TPA: hypothetical protein VGS61_07830, partial [Acidimicrobiales bacterium]|nr:hypothetical protein [Acidimicrobiales bacterium]